MATFRVTIGGENLRRASTAVGDLEDVTLMLAPFEARYRDSPSEPPPSSEPVRVVARIRADSAEVARSRIEQALPEGAEIAAVEPVKAG
jgi:hypothetical protein